MYKFNDREQFLIFTHIPKCSGTSLNEWLKKSLNGKYLYKPVRCGFEWPGLVKNNDVLGYIGSGGHFFYGKNPFHDKNKNIVNISIMRNPLKQFISSYHHIQRYLPIERNDNNNYVFDCLNLTPFELAKRLYDIDNVNDTKSMIFREQFYNFFGYIMMPNLQTKMLSATIDKILCENALENIKKNYFLVGAVEYIHDFYSKLGSFLDINIDYIQKFNVSNQKCEYENSKELKEYIHAINEEDYKLYNALFGEKDL